MTNETLQKLHATAVVAYTEITNLAQDLALPQDEYPLAQIIEVLDDKLCPLCEWLHGKIIQRGTPEWEKYRLPSHINCRRTFAYIPADAEEEPDFEEPPPSLLQKHGHFHTDPLKYEELRVPAFADRRQFIFRRIKDPRTGQLRSELQWLAPRENGDANRYLIDSDLIRPDSQLANILARLPRQHPNKALQELAQLLDAAVDSLQLGSPLHQRIRFNARIPNNYKGAIIISQREIRIDRQTTQLLRELVTGTTPSAAHLEAIEILLHELIQSRSPLLQTTARLPRNRRAPLAQDPSYLIARQTEEGLVELWARLLLRNLSEHPINENADYDYFTAYNPLVRAWRYLQQHLPDARNTFTRWYLEPNNENRNRLLNRYLRQAIESHLESLNPSEVERQTFSILMQRLQAPSEWNPTYLPLIHHDFASIREPLWVLFDQKTQPLASAEIRNAQELIDLLRSFLR